VIKLVALVVAYRLLRPLVMIVIVATLALLLLTGTRDTAGHESHAGRQPQNVIRPLEQLLQRTLQRTIGP
jgi:hypothetical protein